MPINIQQFENASEEELRARGRTNADVILEFLASNPETAYTPKEVHESTGVARGSVGVVLSRLEERGLVRHRGMYWAIRADADADEKPDVGARSRDAKGRSGSDGPDSQRGPLDAPDDRRGSPDSPDDRRGPPDSRGE